MLPDTSQEVMKTVTQELKPIVEENLQELNDLVVIGFKKLITELTNKNLMIDSTDIEAAFEDIDQTLRDNSKTQSQRLEAIEKTLSTKLEKLIKSNTNNFIDFEKLVSNIALMAEKLKPAKASEFKLPTDAKNPIAVRLSDGEKFINQLTNLVQGFTASGGNVPTVKTSSGERAVPISNPDGSALTVEATVNPITGIGHGVKTVTTAGTDVVLASSTTCKRVVIQAQTDNTGLIAVGSSGVDATVATGTGILLSAGDTFELDIDNLADIYIDSTVNGDGVRYTYFT